MALPIPFTPRKLLGRLAGPAASWEPVTRDEVRQLARLCARLLFER